MGSDCDFEHERRTEGGVLSALLHVVVDNALQPCSLLPPGLSAVSSTLVPQKKHTRSFQPRPSQTRGCSFWLFK